MAITAVTLLLDGQEHILTYDEQSGLYEAVITAPDSTSAMNTDGIAPGVGSNARGLGYYPGTLDVSADEEDATFNIGDPIVGEGLKLRVIEIVVPDLASISPTDGGRTEETRPTISFTLHDGGSGIDTDSISVMLDGKAYVPAIGGDMETVSCSFVPDRPLQDGYHTIAVTFSDYDGNAVTATASFITDPKRGTVKCIVMIVPVRPMCDMAVDRPICEMQAIRCAKTEG